MKNIILGMVFLFSLFLTSQVNATTSLLPVRSFCEFWAESVLELIEDEYGCMDGDEYSDVYSALENACESMT